MADNLTPEPGELEDMVILTLPGSNDWLLPREDATQIMQLLTRRARLLQSDWNDSATPWKSQKDQRYSRVFSLTVLTPGMVAAILMKPTD